MVETEQHIYNVKVYHITSIETYVLMTEIFQKHGFVAKSSRLH